MAFSAIYDACVLHPAGLRDLLVRLGQTGLFRARWTDEILDEMARSVLDRYPDITEERIARTRELMCDAVRDCLVTGYEPLIDALELPDPDDRHVLAAAIVSGSEVIVSDNIADFPEPVLAQFNIEAQTADVFVHHLIDLAPTTVNATIDAQLAGLTNPPMTRDQLLDRLEASGLTESVHTLRE